MKINDEWRWYTLIHESDEVSHVHGMITHAPHMLELMFDGGELWDRYRIFRVSTWGDDLYVDLCTKEDPSVTAAILMKIKPCRLRIGDKITTIVQGFAI